jgi:hypothetical protein
MKPILNSALRIVAATLLAAGAGLSAYAQESGAKEDIKDAGRSTKRAVKKTGSATKKAAKKATNATAKTVEKGAEKVKEKTQ